MIFKSFIIEKNISLLDNYNAILFYGENIGLKDDFKDIIKKQSKDADKIFFQQTEIIKNPNLLDEQFFNNSLFSKRKIIFISNFTDKLKNNIINLTEKTNNDTKIVLFADILDKKSTSRTYFEKANNLAIIPCYQDNEKSLSIYLRDKLNNYQGLNQELMNILIKNSGMDRKVLAQEIEKIKGLFSSKKIEQNKIMNLINNVYNLDFENLRDSCFEANKKDLNKNLGNISLQDEKIYFYLADLNNRIQKLFDLNKIFTQNKNIDLSIDSFKPNIFWKDKPVYKKQLKIWNVEKLEIAKQKIIQTEILIKTKFSSFSKILLKKLLIELCIIADSTS